MEAEEELDRSSSSVFQSPPAGHRRGKRVSPAEPEFWLTEGARKSPQEQYRSSERNGTQYRSGLRTKEEGRSGRGEEGSRAGSVRCHQGQNHETGKDGEARQISSSSTDEEMLRRAQEQVGWLCVFWKEGRVGLATHMLTLRPSITRPGKMKYDGRGGGVSYVLLSSGVSRTCSPKAREARKISLECINLVQAENNYNNSVVNNHARCSSVMLLLVVVPVKFVAYFDSRIHDMEPNTTSSIISE